MQDQKILEIGSGYSNLHKCLGGKNVIHVDITRDALHLENICDVHFLPFRDSSFTSIYISHVLEHCYNPYRVLQELKRVSSDKVIIKIPNSLHYRYRDECEEHIYSWNSNTFYNLLSGVFDNVSVTSNFNIRTGKSRVKNMIRVFGYAFIKKLIGFDNELVAFCRCKKC